MRARLRRVRNDDTPAVPGVWDGLPVFRTPGRDEILFAAPGLEVYAVTATPMVN